MSTAIKSLGTALCAALAFCLLSSLAAPVHAQTVVRAFCPEDYGAKMDNKTDDTLAFQACAAAASAVGGTIQVSGQAVITNTITSTNCNIVFTTRDTCLTFYPAAGKHIPLWNIAGSTGRGMTVDGFQANGPGGTNLGVLSTLDDGIEVTGGPVKFRDCSLGRFHSAFNINNTGGHVYWDNCDATSSYYGIWFNNNAGDYKIIDSRLSALFSAIGYGAAGLTLDARRSAIGFSPFAFYQVATSSTNAAGMFHCLLDDVSMEAIGNEAIYSEYARLKPCKSIVNTTDLTITQSGISFLGLYQLSGYPHDYSIEMDAPESEINMDFGISCVPSAKLGRIYVAHPTANSNIWYLKWRNCASSVISVPSGQRLPVTSIQNGF